MDVVAVVQICCIHVGGQFVGDFFGYLGYAYAKWDFFLEHGSPRCFLVVCDNRIIADNKYCVKYFIRTPFGINLAY